MERRVQTDEFLGHMMGIEYGYYVAHLGDVDADPT